MKPSLSIEITNLTRYKIAPFLVKKVVKATLKRAKDISKGFRNLSVAFVSVNEIRKLNREYRKKDQSTDILSFRFDLGYSFNNRHDLKKEKECFEGELIICPQVVKENARQNKTDFYQELTHVISHGILHLFRLNHGKKMFSIQEEVLKEIQKEKAKK